MQKKQKALAKKFSSTLDSLTLTDEHRALLTSVAVRLKERRSFDEREIFVGFGVTKIPPGANIIVTAHPGEPMFPTKLAIVEKAARRIVLNDVKIGMRSQMRSAGALFGEMFSTSKGGGEMQFDTVRVGQFVQLDVTNVSRRIVSFAACIVGRTDFALMLESLLG